MFKTQPICCCLKTITGTRYLSRSFVPVYSLHLNHTFGYERCDRLGPVFSFGNFSLKKREQLLARYLNVSNKNNYVNFYKKDINEESENIKLKELVDNIVESCCEVDILFKSNGSDITSKVVSASLNCGLSAEQIRRIYRHSPELIMKCNITTIFDLLLQLGFSKIKIAQIFVEQSRILMLEKSKVLEVFETLTGLGLPDKCVLNIIKSHPEILFMTPKELKTKVNSLGQIFSLKQVITVLNKMPIVLVEDKGSVLEKCNYARDIMVVDTEQIATSSLLTHSMHSIRCRHMFLERAGLFKKFKQKKGQPNPNPPLKEIMDPTDKKFLKNFIPNATVLDYQTFCKLIEEEIKSQKRDDDDDDDDDDIEDIDY